MFAVFGITFASLAFTWWLGCWVLAKSDGPSGMRSVATAIREGAEGFLATQYGAIMRYGAAPAPNGAQHLVAPSL